MKNRSPHYPGRKNKSRFLFYACMQAIKKMFGSMVVTGAVSNSATESSYKNVRLKLPSFDNAGNMLEEHEDVLTGAIKPNDSKDFKLRYHLPKTTDSIAVSILSANAEE